VTYARPTDFPGLAATITETVDVNVSIPTNHQDAEKLYRQGNVVRVIGQLDCRMEFQGGAAVRSKLEEIDVEWAEHKAELAEKPGELRKAEDNYRRIRQRFEAAARLFVLVGYAELITGEPLPLQETFAARREFVRNRRQQQEARRQRVAGEQAQRAKRGTLHSDVAESVDGMPILATADVGMHPQAGLTKAARPRKRAMEHPVEQSDEPEIGGVLIDDNEREEPVEIGAV
jgi:hypothetical protein